MNVIHNISKEEQLLKASFEDLIAFGKLFLPGDFRKTETPLFHYEIADALTSLSTKPLALLLVRDSAKTTLTKACIIRDFCFSRKAAEWGFRDEEDILFYGWVSDSQRKSIKNVAYVKLHLEHNEKIRYYFGDNRLKSLRGSTWNQEDIVDFNGNRLISSSNLTSMRGDTQATIEKGALRYSKVFVDDAENEGNTITEVARNKIEDNILNGILPAIEKNQPGRCLVFSGTPVHYDSMVQRIMDKWKKATRDAGGIDPFMWTSDSRELDIRRKVQDKFPWRVITYRSTQPNLPGKVLWHSYKSRKVLDQTKEEYRISKKGLSGYYQEYELEVQRAETARFTRDHIQYHKAVYKFEDGHSYVYTGGARIPVNTFLGCDPATDIEKNDSDFSVIMVIAVDPDSNKLVLEYVRERSAVTIGLRNSEDKLIGREGVVDYIMRLYAKYHCISGAVEDVAMNRSIFNSLNQRKIATNKMGIAVSGEEPGGMNKLNRIYSSLSSDFSTRKIFLKEDMYALENEIITFGPSMGHDDTIEALYYANKRAFPPVVKKPVMKRQHGMRTPTIVKPKKKSWIVL